MHAQWQDNGQTSYTQYTITFDTHSDSEIGAITQNGGTQVSKPTPDPEKDGHTFTGWYNAETGGALYTWPHTLNANVTMHAQWWNNSDGTYTPSTITFDSNGGSIVDSITAPPSTSIGKPSNPVKAGLTFSGWFNAATGGTEYTWPHTLSGDVTMHAQWKATVTFHSNGGSPVTAQSVTVGEKAADPGNITVSGALFAGTVSNPASFAFDGWYINPEYTSGSSWNFNYTVTGNINLYARWKVDAKSAIDISGQSGANIIAKALNYIKAQTSLSPGTNYTIVLAESEYTLPGISIGMEVLGGPSAVSGNITNPNAVITLAGKSATDISLSPGVSGSLFVITGGGLILGSNITLTGSASNTASLVTVVGEDASLIMDGATITGNTSISIPGGGVMTIFGGSFTLNNGTISDNRAPVGGGVMAVFDSSFTMNGGTITGNTAFGGPANFGDEDGCGGGVMIVFSEFTLTDGTISGNIASNDASTGGQGAGVAIIGGGMPGDGTTIGSATFTMSGGTISGNSAIERGGGVYVNNDDDDIEDSTTATFTMSDGTISDNTAGRGAGVWIQDGASFSKTGNSIIYGDTDKTYTPGNDENTGTASTHTYTGHAVWYHASASHNYYRNATLNSGDNINTSNVPSGGSGYNWTEEGWAE
jgi:uncharacterized repeat protein (TIGR02543 family)